MKRTRHILFLCLFASCAVFANGLEFRLTISGKILLGIAYRHQVDANTAVRFGSYIGLAGAPVGLHLGLLQDLSPHHAWTPFFELGADMLLYKQKKSIHRKIYPSSTIGFTYCPTAHLKHSAELWLGYLAGSVRPVGLSYVHFNAVR